MTGGPEVSKTLERGLRLLRVLASDDAPMSVPALAQALGTNRAGVYRLLGPLVAHRLVCRDDRSRVALAPGLLDLARRVRVDLREVALPHLRRLADDLVATAALTVLDGSDAIVASTAEPRQAAMHIAYRVGSRHPADRGASGLAILAARPATSGERAAVGEARRKGHASSASELQLGAFGVAAPILVSGREAYASIGVISLTPLDETEVAARLRSAAQAIAALIG